MNLGKKLVLKNGTTGLFFNNAYFFLRFIYSSIFFIQNWGIYVEIFLQFVLDMGGGGCLHVSGQHLVGLNISSTQKIVLGGWGYIRIILLKLENNLFEKMSQIGRFIKKHPSNFLIQTFYSKRLQLRIFLNIICPFSFKRRTISNKDQVDVPFRNQLKFFKVL